MKVYEVPFEGTVTIRVPDEDAFTRVDDEWREGLYDLNGIPAILEHWAFNAVANGVERANRLDGWADMGEANTPVFLIFPHVEAFGRDARLVVESV
jgi:hypothetical protein